MARSSQWSRIVLATGLILASHTRSLAEMPTWASAGRIETAETGWRASLAEGWRESKATGLPMVIFITSENCLYCKAMEKNTWCTDDVRQQMAGKFIPVRLIAGRNTKSLSRVNVEVYPTTLLATPEGDVVAHRKGFQPPERIRQLLGHLSVRDRLTH